MRWALCIQLVALIMLANGAPIIAKRLLGERWSRPLDGGLVLGDGQPLLGHSKTIRGVVAAVIAGTIGAYLLGLGALAGLWIGATAMAGDLFSSFLKRRLGMPPSSRATGLDQIPESLLPALAVRHALALHWLEIAAIVSMFMIGEMLISRVLYKLRIRDRPY
jgi:CDP-2,3-bis-(O-geranylgeranyl)-sn-glycerol synthase